MKGPLRNKSYAFAIEIVQLTEDLQKQRKEYVMTKQLLRSGTGISALVREAEFGRSKKDFSNKLSMALKEANETEYWLCLLKDTQYLEQNKFKVLQSNCKELIAMLVSSVKTSNS
jgi:four helix bundle protein